MSTELLQQEALSGLVTELHPQGITESEIITDARKACERIAPVWPLRHFVAVNPYLGLSEFHFVQAAQILAHSNNAKNVAPRALIAEAIENGEITDADLQNAIDQAPALQGMTVTVDDLKAQSQQEPEALPVWSNVTDVAGELTGLDWSKFALNQISRWSSAYFDEGQAFWSLPEKGQNIFTAWLSYARQDRTPDALGLKGFRKALAGISTNPGTCIEEGIHDLQIPEACREAYFYRCLSSIAGWSALARYHGWDAELDQEQDDTLIGLLAIRVAIDVATYLSVAQHEQYNTAWQKCLTEYRNNGVSGISVDVYINCLLQSAYDNAAQRQLVDDFNAAPKAPKSLRKDAQAVFCIDVRSEVYRRAIEKVNAQIETLGFAGFFGFSIEYVPLGEQDGGSQCPVLLKPSYVIRETLSCSHEDEHDEVMGLRILRRRAAKAWKSFKLSAVSSFSFVETMGLTYIFKLISDGFGITRTVPHPSEDGLDQDVNLRRKPDIHPGHVHERSSGISLEERIDLAQGALKGMSLSAPFAPIVLFVGHGSTTVNNPHASGLDCGACGGHTGEANARVAAAVLNDPAVRDGLAKRGVDIPKDTVFLGALHDTTTDEVMIYDTEELDESYQNKLYHLRKSFSEASLIAREERSANLDLRDVSSVHEAIIDKSSDWSQVRPELGLAGCSAFVVAPRHRTANLNLDGRSFLHSYEWNQDEGFQVLELIMTAPMIVTSWINLQYFGSTVDNESYGSGNKTLHNVVGQMGVLEGNGGDLRVGLPWQSVHNGKQYLHKPLRLAVMIEAPIEAMNKIIANNESVRQLLDNEWIYLYAINSDGQVANRYQKDLQWQDLPVQSEADVVDISAAK